jgi:HK97 gp10 family phage protein
MASPRTKEFKEYLERAREIAMQAAYAQVVAEAYTIAADMRNKAPVKTGRLRDSIRVEEDANKQRAIIRAGGPSTTVPVRKGVSASYDYALAQEWGTQKLEAQPFFYPTWRADRPKAATRIKATLKKAIEAVR